MPASSAAWMVAMLSRPVGRAVHAGHAHAAEAEGRNARAGRAELRGFPPMAHVIEDSRRRGRNPDHETARGKPDPGQITPQPRAERSDAAALARHLGGFGEIRITRLDPETAVAWEGEQVRGTVRIEPAGWGDGR